MRFNNIGVIGAGTMGISVAIDLVLHGVNTILVDVSDDILRNAQNEIIKGLRFAPLIKKDIPKILPDQALKKITFTTNLRNVEACDFIIENVTENWDVKKEVYSTIDEICNKNVCFGVNTSCISISKVGSSTTRPDKVIGIHFMNPVFKKPVVEVIKGFHTSDETIEVAKGFLTAIDKQAIIVNDYTGFVSNRISHLFMNEAAFVVQDHIATPAQVDAIFKKCYEHKMGPLETADLIGLDTVVNSLNVLYESYQDSKFRCCPLLRKMVDAGLLGRKSGEGFYKY